MHSYTHPRRRVTLAALALAAAAAAALAVVLLLPTSSTAAGKRVAKEGNVASLGKTVLTNNSGRTLYTLSVEKNGKFTCVESCTSTWRPLTVAAGTKPTGPVALGTVKRPEGKTQVTFKGHPLYTFAGDSKAGQANGEGVRDVGTWHAATIAKSSSGSETMPSQPEPNPYGY